MSKRKNIKTIILTLTLFISTISFCNANAMEVNQINNNLNNQNNNKQSKIDYEKLRKLNLNEDKKAKEKFDLKIKDIFKPVKDSYFQKKYEDSELIENLTDAYLENDLFKYKNKDYEINSNKFLYDYETNGFIDDNMEYYLKALKNELLEQTCLDDKKELNKEQFIKIMKDYIESKIKIDCSNLDFTIPIYSEEKLKDYFNEHKERIDNFLIEYQIRYKQITEKIENYKNKIKPKKITPEIIEQFKKKLLDKIHMFKSKTINQLEQKVDNGCCLNQRIIDNNTYYNKIILLNYVGLTENNKLDKDKFIRILKKFKIIGNNSNYIIDKKEEQNLLPFLCECKDIIEKKCSKESINKLINKSPLLKEALDFYNYNSDDDSDDNSNETKGNDSSTLFYPPSDKK